jgi:hypothetical protein
MNKDWFSLRLTAGGSMLFYRCGHETRLRAEALQRAGTVTPACPALGRDRGR